MNHEQQKSERPSVSEVIARVEDRVASFGRWVFEQSTFFRIHLFSFVFVPLVFSGIFYGSNGRFPANYLNALFLCYSAMTGTGLSTLNLSTLTAFQQALLYFLMMVGTPTATSWLMILVRRHYILTECTDAFWRKRQKEIPLTSNMKTREQLLNKAISSPQNPRLAGHLPGIELVEPTPVPTPSTSRGLTVLVGTLDPPEIPKKEAIFFQGQPITSSPKGNEEDLPAASPNNTSWTYIDATSPVSVDTNNFQHRRRFSFIAAAHPRARLRGKTMVSLKDHPFSSHVEGIESKYQGEGGFPSFLQIVKKITQKVAPNTYLKVERSITIQTPPPIVLGEGTDPIIPGRNSNFRTQSLNDEQLEEVGGLEYRAVNLLCYVIPLYFVTIQLITFLMFGPWLIATKEYDGVFEAQPRLVSKTWYTLFLAMSSYSGTGLDLCDTAMLPFQRAYPMIFGVMFCLLAGNHAQPVILRFLIWIVYRCTKPNTHRRTLKFLLDHPRRCYLYLFPSAQTWFLLIVICSLSALEWSSFGILNLELPVLNDLPLASRVIVGLFQGIAVRASGLNIIALADTAPALQFLYLVLMYIAVYPVGMCIRSTNVYEEKSLGIFEVPEGDIQENLEELEVGEGVGRYLGWHLRQQMAVDVWWLVWGIVVIAITERGNIMNQDKSFLTLFTVTFELVSAFAGIGLSFGFPFDNYSLVGQMRKLSKIVVIIIMIRGRHRGLPVAVDRAVLLPKEYAKDTPPRKNSASRGLRLDRMAVHTV